MKRMLLAAMLLYCATLRLGAQQQIRHEFSMGFGVGNNMADKKVNDVVNHYLETYHMESEMGCSDFVGDSCAISQIQLAYYHARTHATLFSDGFGNHQTTHVIRLSAGCF